jgi:glucose-1-phosphate thymidylyltransferase
MKAIVLAGGYWTRLLPLTKNTPKQLLQVNKKPIIDYAIDKVIKLWITDITVVSNDKFYKQFQARAQNHKYSKYIKTINDQTKSNEDRLWAIWDIQYVIDQEQIDDDVLVIWSDNIFKFELAKTYQLFKKTNKTTVIGFDVQDIDLAKKYGIISVDDTHKVTDFLEKPQNPPSTLVAICVYFYPKHIIPQIQEYLQIWQKTLNTEQYNKRKDSPGNFPARLIDKDWVYAQTHKEKRYDVWGFESLKAAKEEYWETNIDIENIKQWTQ